MKGNLIKACSCRCCGRSKTRKSFTKQAIKKSRHQSKQALRSLSDWDKYIELAVSIPHSD